MEKRIRTILCATAFAIPAVSCTVETDNTEPGAGNTIEISVNGLMGEYTQADAVKSSMVNTVRVSWENGDIVYVYDGTQCLGSLAASLDGDENRYALLSTDDTHTVSTPAAGTTKLTLVHSPQLSAAPEVNDGVISISLAGQSGTKTPFIAYATLDYDNGASITGAVVPFKFATSVVKVNCTGLYANAAISAATLSNVNTTCSLALSGSAAPAVTGAVNGTITRTGDAYFDASKVNAEGEAVFQIALPVLGNSTAERILTVSQGEAVFRDMEFTKKSLSAATSVNTVCQLACVLPAGALPGRFSVAEGRQVHFSKGNLYWNGSSFLFEENQYGFTFNWDESHISHFYWSKEASVVYAMSYSDPEANASDVLFTNASETTAKSDFTVNGVTGKYRTLSRAEWGYLFNDRAMENVSFRFTPNITFGGNKGVVLYPDDYSGSVISSPATELPEGVVFLPDTGKRYGRDFIESGGYWTSSPKEKDAENAYYMFCFSDIIIPYDYYVRYVSYSIRPVTDCAAVIGD